MIELAGPDQDSRRQAVGLNGHTTGATIIDGQASGVTFVNGALHPALHPGAGAIIWRKAMACVARARPKPAKRDAAEDFDATLRRMNEHLALVSHELRNALGSIRFAMRLIEMKSHEPLLVERTRVSIDRQTGQMARIIDDLLDIALMRSGRFALHRERVDLRVVAKHAVESIEPELNHRSQRLTVTLPQAPVWMQADPGRLAQVLVNLLSNAAKYTDMGGDLRLSVEYEAGHATIRVRDSGIGIAADVLPHVFEPFMQAAASPTRSDMGIGMGLALVSRLVEMHGGHVSAASAGLGRGSEFTVDLPATSI